MKMQQISLGLTIVNLILMVFLFAQIYQAHAQREIAQPSAAILRGRALEIVDSVGKVRASITIQPATEVDGKWYPQTVLFRLIDNKGGPLVKLTAGDNGSGLSLSDETDGGILIRARDTGSFFKITNRGRERIIKP